MTNEMDEPERLIADNPNVVEFDVARSPWRLPSWRASTENLAAACEMRFGEQFRYVPMWRAWYHWDGRVWRPDTTLRVEMAIRDLVLEVARGRKGRQRDRLENVVVTQTIERRLRGLLAVDTAAWNSDIHLLNTPLGSIDLRKGNGLRPHRREDFCTTMTAVAPHGTCPQWLDFIDFVTMGNGELAAYLQRICGAFLSGDIDDQAAFFLYGTGANGKSVFTTVLNHVLGNDYVRNASIRTFTLGKQEQHPEGLARLFGARLVLVSETNPDRAWDESMIKSVTGGEKINARKMYADSFEYTPQFKIVIAGNHKPVLQTSDPAIQRRLHIVPFVNTLPEEARDPRKAERLMAEGPGILQWALDGYAVRKRAGLNAPTIVVEANEEYFDDQAMEVMWIDEHCDTSNPLVRSETKTLYFDNERWRSERGEKPRTMRAFTNALAATVYGGKKFERFRSKQGRGFKGIELRAAMPAEDQRSMFRDG
jgi:putative DNA primase/helicase